MHTKSIATLVLILHCFFPLIASAQQTKKKASKIQTLPPFTFQINFNYNQSALELYGGYNDYVRSEFIYQGKSFGADNGFGGSLVSKIRLGENGMFRFNQVIAYNRQLSYPYKDIESVNDVGEAYYNAFTGGLSIEYCFTPANKFRAYVGVEINASIINGDLKVWFQRLGHPNADSIASYKITNSFRQGYGLNIGTEYILNRHTGFNIGLIFMNLNAFARESEGSNDEAEFEMRDDDNPSLIFAGNKNFAFYSLVLGVNIYFGVKSVKQNLKE